MFASRCEGPTSSCHQSKCRHGSSCRHAQELVRLVKDFQESEFGLLTTRLGQIVEVEGGTITGIQRLLTNEGCGSWVQVDGVGETLDQVIKCDVEAVTREVSMVS